MQKHLITTAAIGALLMATACNSSGTKRYASIGTPGASGAAGKVGPAGPQGEQGPAGPQGERGAPGADGRDGIDGRDGTDGADGMDGMNGMDGQDGNFGLGEAGMIAVGGLTGDNGIGGTGLLANLGDPSTSPPVIGEPAVSLGDTLSETGEQLAAGVGGSDGNVVSDIIVAAADTVTATGDALSGFGNGEQPLVDGVLEAPSPILTASVGAADVVGGADGSESLIGTSILAADQQSGTLGEIGVGSNDTLLNADLAPNSDGGLDIPGVASVDVIGGEGDLIDGEATLASVNLLDQSESLGGDGEVGLIGLSVLSEEQASGTLLEAGVASDDTLLNVDLAPESEGGLEIPGVATVDVVGGVEDTLGGTDLLDPDSSGDLLADAGEDLQEGLEDLLSGEGKAGLLDGVTGSSDDDSEGGLGGLLSGLGGGR